MNSRRGLALIIVAGVLGLLAALAMAFTTLAQLERRASRQRLNVTKATLLARSGIEDAMARLGQDQDPLLPSNSYRGEDWDGSGGVLSVFEAQQEVVRPGVADIEDCPVKQALRPSFFADDGTGKPRYRAMDGRQRGYSGRLQGDATAGGNLYALKVTTEGGFYVNGGDPSLPVDTAVSDYNLVMRRMLGTLAEAVDQDLVAGVPGADDGSPVDQVDGFNLIDLRPLTSRGWEDWDQVRDIALGGVQAKLDALKPYLALHARVDKKVIRPNAVGGTVPPGMENRDCKSWADIKMAHETYPGAPGTREPDFERIPVLPTGRIVGRAPVDLAWARTRRPALIALLAGLKGLWLDNVPTSLSDYCDFIGKIRTAEIVLDWTGTSDDCLLAAGRILAYTGELATWEQWNDFCDGITQFSGSPDIRLAKQSLLKANFNPNSDLNKFNPNASLWKTVDKSDLLVHSTEFSLLPQASPQELECVGRVLDRNGRVLASRVLKATIAPAECVTLTTQKEFVCEDLGDPSVAGDEGSPRLPGSPAFISQSQGAGVKTWGYALGLGGLGVSGASLQTYPEPCVDTRPYPQSPPAVLSTRPADYDGSVQLATIETGSNPEEFYGVDLITPIPPSVLDMKLLARYTTGLDLDVSDAAPTRPSADARWKNQPDIEQVTYNGAGSPILSQLGNGLWDAARPNTLYPDGVYSETDRTPSYLDRNNANGFHGVISFWAKMSYPPLRLDSSSGGDSWALHTLLRWSNDFNNIAGMSNTQFFVLGSGYYYYGISCHFQLGHANSDERIEHTYRNFSRLVPVRRWNLITQYYDFRSPYRSKCGALWHDDAGTTNSRYAGGINNDDPGLADDITLPDKYGDHQLVLGKEGVKGAMNYTAGYYPSGADVTFDELAIYDFGGTEFITGTTNVTPASQATLNSPGKLASNRFKEGRYYRESEYPAAGTGLTTPPGPGRRAAEYFSPPISLGACRIKALAWTQIVPWKLQASVITQAAYDETVTWEDHWEDQDYDGVDETFVPAGSYTYQVPAVWSDTDAAPGGAILLELADTLGTGYLQDASGNSINTLFTRSALERVDRTVNAPFRLHAVFQPNLKDRENTPILDPLALDDVTVVYEPLGGRRILAWERE